MRINKFAAKSGAEICTNHHLEQQKQGAGSQNSDNHATPKQQELLYYETERHTKAFRGHRCAPDFDRGFVQHFEDFDRGFVQHFERKEASRKDEEELVCVSDVDCGGSAIQENIYYIVNFVQRFVSVVWIVRIPTKRRSRVKPAIPGSSGILSHL